MNAEALSDKEQTYMIFAKALNWTQLHLFENKIYGTIPDADEFDSQGALEHYYQIQDFENDLNAMHKLEKILTNVEYSYYITLLEQTVWENEGDRYHRKYPHSATAKQRADSILQVLLKRK